MPGNGMTSGDGLGIVLSPVPARLAEQKVQHIAWSKDGRRAKLYPLSRFTAMPEINLPAVRMEQAVSFVREKGIGKIESTTLIVDPDTIKRPRDTLFNRDDVDRERDADIRGRIVRIEFMKDHTLVIVRVRDEEHAVFLQPAEALPEAGVPLDEFSRGPCMSLG